MLRSLSQPAFSLLAGLGLLAAVGTTIVLAQAGDPIAERKASMKSVGAATGRAAAMLRGQQPFDEAAAKDVLNAYIASAQKMPALYPDTSKTGGETRAAPKIWEEKAKFEAAFAKFEADAKAALDKTGTLESFRTAFGDVTKNCDTCHEPYRLSR